MCSEYPCFVHPGRQKQAPEASSAGKRSDIQVELLCFCAGVPCSSELEESDIERRCIRLVYTGKDVRGRRSNAVADCQIDQRPRLASHSDSDHLAAGSYVLQWYFPANRCGSMIAPCRPMGPQILKCNPAGSSLICQYTHEGLHDYASISLMHVSGYGHMFT